MAWVIIVAVIFIVLFVMILVPKAAKSYTDTEKLKDVAWGRGFSRIYFIASAAWIGGFFWMLVTDPDVPQSRVPLILTVINSLQHPHFLHDMVTVNHHPELFHPRAFVYRPPQ